MQNYYHCSLLWQKKLTPYQFPFKWILIFQLKPFGRGRCFRFSYSGIDFWQNFPQTKKEAYKNQNEISFLFTIPIFNFFLILSKILAIFFFLHISHHYLLHSTANVIFFFCALMASKCCDS